MNEFNRKQAHSRNRQTFICTHLYFAAKVNNAICWMYCTEWYVYVRNPCANASMQCTLYIEQTYGIETKHGRKSWWYCICPKRSGVVWLKIATTKKPLRLIEITSRSQRMEIAEISPFRSILLKLVQHNRADFFFSMCNHHICNLSFSSHPPISQCQSTVFCVCSTVVFFWLFVIMKLIS